jgi:uncharacterized damage-inducible protein DinB
MNANDDLISELEYARASLFKAIDGLSRRELVETPIYGDWTIKDVLAHIIGWDYYVIGVLQLMLQDRPTDLPAVDADLRNRKSIAVWQDRPLAEVMAEAQATHRQILEIISSLDQPEIDKRRERNGRMITIRSYVVGTLDEHERQHALEIEEWRRNLEQGIDPDLIIATLNQSRVAFTSLLDEVEESEVTAKGAIGVWSVNDLVGHVADWEQRMLDAARHINDPAKPVVPPVGDDDADWNAIMVARRADKSWPETYHFLRRTQQAVDDFVADLKPENWRLRGPYPFNDRGTLAELIIQIADHYQDHTPGLVAWYENRSNFSVPFTSTN